MKSDITLARNRTRAEKLTGQVPLALPRSLFETLYRQAVEHGEAGDRPARRPSKGERDAVVARYIASLVDGFEPEPGGASAGKERF